METVPKRSDECYIEIENFKAYELTNNVAYEMMIRNDEFIRDRLSVIMHESTILMSFLSNEHLFNAIIKECKRAKLLNYPSSKQEIEEYLQNYDHEQGFDYLIQSSNKWGVGLNEFINAYDYEICFLNSHNYFKVNNEYKEESKITNLREDVTSHYDFSFSRPKIEIKNISKIVEIKLNLSFPKNELIEMMSKIKDEADKNNIKTPLELLGEELQKADNLLCNTKGKCFDTRAYLSKQQKVADMFFIYDCLKVGMTQRKIQNEVYNYYADKQIETITLDAKTLKKYKDIAIDYIDNMRYKELVTGVKLECL